MAEWIKRNSVGLALAGTMIAIMVMLVFVASGCSASDLIQVRVPSGVQRSISTPKLVPLSDAPHEWDRWILFVETESERFSDSIARGQELLGFVQSMTNTGLGLAEQALGGIPFGGALIGGLGLVSGIFFDKPGAKKKEASEKQASYNAGMAKGKKMAEEIARELRG